MINLSHDQNSILIAIGDQVIGVDLESAQIIDDAMMGNINCSREKPFPHLNAIAPKKLNPHCLLVPTEGVEPTHPHGY